MYFLTNLKVYSDSLDVFFSKFSFAQVTTSLVQYLGIVLKILNEVLWLKISLKMLKLSQEFENRFRVV